MSVIEPDARAGQDLVNRLLAIDASIADMRRQNDDVERDIETRLLPEIERQRAERDALRLRLKRLDGPDRERSEALERTLRLEANLAAARYEVQALRRSLSWRITAPLRLAYDWLLKVYR
jgi:predicted RNase H-like nuclease (RuvC/YqgF family)